jgi:hypothetical protein
MTVSDGAAFSRGNDDAQGREDVRIWGISAQQVRFAIAPDAVL